MKQEIKFISLVLVLLMFLLPALGCKNNKNIEATATPSSLESGEPSDSTTNTPSAGIDAYTTATNGDDTLAPGAPTSAPAPTTTNAAFNPSPTSINVSTAKWVATELSFTSSKTYADKALISGGAQSTFETTSIPTGWSAFGGGTLSISSDVAHSGTKSVCFPNRADAWQSPAFNLYDTFKSGGAGTYNISFWIYANAFSTASTTGRMLIRGDSSADANSFIVNQNGAYYAPLVANVSTAANTWTHYSANLTVLASDITRVSGTFNVMVDVLEAVSGQKLYFDDFEVSKVSSFSPFNDVQMDATFTGPNNAKIVMPSFWDGGNTWKVRFAPTMTGTWTFSTACSDTSDYGLNGKTGTVNCTPYTGNLDIYKHGFVKAIPNTRYFEYDDGTPFFYLGDTHWSLPSEPYDTMFKTIINKRVQQGFTVIQSEPLGAAYTLSDGVSNADMAGFADMDNRFKYIANAGLVHANAEFFFVAELSNNASSYSAAYLDKLSRYWVARYGAYPVMWTTAQECDNNLYGTFDIATNPWKSVLQSVYNYDPYKHPSTAHQENTSVTQASDSTFKDLSGYKWFGAQWSAAKNGQLDFNVVKDYWNKSGVRPVVDYEGHYQNLWTNEFGARMQGWTAYLNGMYGQGYGAEDIWLYNSTYDMANDSVVYGITITVADKQVKWNTSLEFAAAYQLGYMHNFFNSIEWWNLTPRFDDSAWFSNNGSWYSLASKGNDLYVAYFYNNTNQKTGTLKGLANVQYTAQWFNPITGSYNTAFNLSITNGTYAIGSKPDNNDWVLLLKKS